MIAIWNNCHISLFFVDRDFHTGLGKTLIEEGIKWCKQTKGNVKEVNVCAAPNFRVWQV
jgi:hypothetical protein